MLENLKRYMIKLQLFILHFSRKDRDATNDVILTTFGQKYQHATKAGFTRCVVRIRDASYVMICASYV